MSTAKRAIENQMEYDAFTDLHPCEDCGKKTVNLADMPHENGAPVWVLCETCLDSRPS